jgi:DeoR/GlpR family transcriptional regulator of sugar metabolism
MIPAERRTKILDHINTNGSAKVSDLSQLFQVSEMTIHRDLNILERTGRIRKSYGGAISTQTGVNLEFRTRAQANVEAKRAIGRKAASLVQAGESILIDASTTALAMIPELESIKGLTVFSTGIPALAALSNIPHIRVYGTGGELYHPSQEFFGMQTLAFLKEIHVDKYFAGAGGLHARHGVTDPLLQEVEVKRQSAQSAKELIVLADLTKFGRVAEFNTFALDEIDLIITEASEHPSSPGNGDPCLEEVLDMGANVIFAK